MNSKINELATNLISLAERMFGTMTSDWKYRGIEFNDHPPYLAYYPAHGEVAISLSLKTIDDDIQLIFQLAHEVCHLLYPAMDKQTATAAPSNVINEGISTFFSIFTLRSFFGDETADMARDNLMLHAPNYFAAYELILNLTNRDEDAVKKIRKIQPKINNLNKLELQLAGLQLTEDEIASLTANF